MFCTVFSVSLTNSIADSVSPITLVGVRRNPKFTGVALVCKSQNQQEHLSLPGLVDRAASALLGQCCGSEWHSQGAVRLCAEQMHRQSILSSPLNTEVVRVQSPAYRKWRYILVDNVLPPFAFPLREKLLGKTN